MSRINNNFPPFSIHLSPLFLLLFCTIKAIPFIYHPHHAKLPFFFCCGEKGRLIQTKVKTKSGPFLVVLRIICSLHFLHEPELDSNPPTASLWTNTFSCRFFFCSKDRRVMSGLVSVTTCWSFHWTRGISPHLGHFLQSFRWPAEAEAAEGRKEGRLFLSNSFNSRSDPKKQINPTPCPTYSHSLDVSEGKGFISLSFPFLLLRSSSHEERVLICAPFGVCAYHSSSPPPLVREIVGLRVVYRFTLKWLFRFRIRRKSSFPFPPSPPPSAGKWNISLTHRKGKAVRLSIIRVFGVTVFLLFCFPRSVSLRGWTELCDSNNSPEYQFNWLSCRYDEVVALITL